MSVYVDITYLALSIQGESSAMKKLKSGFAQSRPLDEELDRAVKEELKDIQSLKSSDEDEVVEKIERLFLLYTTSLVTFN